MPEGLPIAWKTVRDRRRSLLLWAAGLAVVVAVYMPVYPQMEEAGSLEAQTEALPDGVTTALGFDDTSAAGYVTATVYGLLVPLLLLVFATAFGARAVAGEEEEGVLDLYLAHPVSRRRLLLERFAAMAGCIAAFGVLVGLLVTAFAAGLGMDIGAAEVAGTSLGLALFVLGFGTLALTVGALTGRRGMVLGVTAGVAAAAYLLYALAPQIGALEGWDRLSPFFYYLDGQPLTAGPDWAHLAVLAAIPAALIAVAGAGFQRRDLNV